MIKVLIVTPSLRRGGMERQLSYLLKHFDRNKLKITVAVLFDEIEYPVPQDIEVVTLGYKRRSLSFYLRLASLLLKGFDVLNSRVSGLNELMMVFGILLFRKKLILEVRNSGKRLEGVYRKMTGLSRFVLFKWTVVANNKRALNELEGILPKRFELVHIPNGVDTGHFSPWSASPLRKASNEIGFLGRVIPRKKLDTIVRALAKSDASSPQLIIKGTTSEDVQYVQGLMTLIKQLGVENRVSFEPPSEDITAFFQRVNALILPSEAEGSPNVVLEAMASGCPVLCSDAIGVEYLLDDRFIFPCGDSEALHARIVMLMEMSVENLQEVIEVNRRTVEQYHSISSLVENYTLLYQRVAADKQ